ncbi:phosphotransferase [Brevibacillus reuszeri]|uniref:phosphotransferase n=1 Tax=Brevibacillus reuszeri TaxID=54915 RepID=UPI000CCBD82A|nr:phosphotransferase [Brevibacillus reuszeri]
MRVKYNIDESVLASILNQEYEIHVKDITFIPHGTSAYSYKVIDHTGSCYFLKLFDTTDEHQKRSAQLLDSYLPMTWEMHPLGIMKNLTYPIKTKNGHYHTGFKEIVLILCNFVEGKTLKESSSSKETLDKIAKVVATLHKATPDIKNHRALQEQFHNGAQLGLKQCLTALESKTIIHNPYTEALKKLVLPKKEAISRLSDVLMELSSSVACIQTERVYCHGDLWAGNIIINQDELFLIDWEHSLLAPAECDLTYFIGDGKNFAFFFNQYENYFGKKVILYTDLLRYYLHRRMLTHLTHLMRNILYKNKKEADNQFDIDTIARYYIDKLDQIETVVKKVKSDLADHIV